MAKLERTYNIPLRKEFLKANRYRRAEKAVIAVKDFLVKHMKSEDVRLGKYLNQAIWANGVRNPPHHIKVIATKEDDGKVIAELADAPVAKETAEKKEVKKVAKEGENEIKEELAKVEKKTESIKAEKAKAAPKKKAAAKKE